MMWEQFIRSLEKDIEAEKRFIAPLEDGSTRLYSGPSGTQLRETTQEQIDRSRSIIKNLQAVIARVKKESA